MFFGIEVENFCRRGFFILGNPGAVSRVGRKGGRKVFKYGRKSPWVPTLTELFPKIQADVSSRLGTTNALYYCAQSANRLTAPGSPRMGVLNQQILIHRCLLYEESMECGPPCHISGCKKVQFYYLRLVYLYRLKST